MHKHTGIIPITPWAVKVKATIRYEIIRHLNIWSAALDSLGTKLREKLGIPIPGIYGWPVEASNPVGAEYILEEKASSQTPGSVWDKLPMAARLEIVNQVVDMEKRFTSISFPKHGCIYYESDLKSRSFDYERLGLLYDLSSTSEVGQKHQLPGFVIGPSTSPKFWEGEKGTMNLDRGPCTLLRYNVVLLANMGIGNDVADYATAVATNELEWAILHARSRMNFHRSMESPETLVNYISFKHYMDGTCSIPGSRFAYRATKQDSHPDLHLDNIFFYSWTNRITCIIDWQQASVCPIPLHRTHPQMLELSATSQSDQSTQQRELLDNYYAAVKKADPSRWKALNEYSLAVRTGPISSVPGCWAREDLFSLRNALVTVVARWKDIGDSEKPCPVNFGEEELLQDQTRWSSVREFQLLATSCKVKGLSH